MTQKKIDYPNSNFGYNLIWRGPDGKIKGVKSVVVDCRKK